MLPNQPSTFIQATSSCPTPPTLRDALHDCSVGVPSRLPGPDFAKLSTALRSTSSRRLGQHAHHRGQDPPPRSQDVASLPAPMTTPGARRHFPRSPTEAVGLSASHSTSTPGAAPLHLAPTMLTFFRRRLQHQPQLGRHHSSLVFFGADVLPASSSTSTTKGEEPHLPSRLHS